MNKATRGLSAMLGRCLAIVLAWGLCGPVQSRAAEPANGKTLFERHCVACHGDKGDGAGIAARFLYPKPRDFTKAAFRLVTTANLKPSDEDLFNVITNGMPGSAMFPFRHLSQAERQALVTHVRSLMRAGMMEIIRKEAEEGGEKPTPAELEKAADQVLKPGEPIKLPAEMPAANAESVTRGKEFYAKGCAACHGDTGKGDGQQNQKNDDGMPTSPRDFTRGIFKGGRDPRQLYARIALGMPGSPMPATINLKPSEMGDLVNYILSLPEQGSEKRAEHRRSVITAKRDANSLPATIPEQLWATAEQSPIIVTPLWWRRFPDPDLHVAALHDGTSLAIRLTWHDETRNDRMQKPDDFEDMAAIQLYRGAAEPFIGMGGAGQAVDAWLWRASWQQPPAAAALDDYALDSPFFREWFKSKNVPLPDFLTARAAGNQNARGEPARSGSNLTAGGPGSMTYRPKTSQLVTATSTWKDGRWTVILRRPLVVKPDDGIALSAGDSCSIAFALWDGAARDRNGQKLVSIWHDLKLQK